MHPHQPLAPLVVYAREVEGGQVQPVQVHHQASELWQVASQPLPVRLPPGLPSTAAAAHKIGPG